MFEAQASVGFITVWICSVLLKTHEISPFVRESGFRNRENLCFWNPESNKFCRWILDFGIRNTALGIQNPTSDWNPKSKFHWQRILNPVPGIRNQRRGIQDPRLFWISLHGVGLRWAFPSPKSILTLTSHLGQNCDLREG